MKVIFSFIFILLFSTACTNTAVENKQSIVIREALLKNLNQWHIQGRLAITNGVEAYSVKLQWKQQDDTFHLAIIAPVGHQGVILTGNNKQMIAKFSNGQVIHAQNPESFLQKQMGWDLPVSQLRYWILGSTKPQQNIVLDQSTNLPTLRKVSGWKIEYLQYKIVQKLALPKRIDMEKGDIKIRLIIDNWEFLAPLPKVSVLVSTKEKHAYLEL